MKKQILFVGDIDDLTKALRPGAGFVRRFNTLRLGDKWSGLVKPGEVVDLVHLRPGDVSSPARPRGEDVKTHMWEATVVELGTGPLASLLDRYARSNCAFPEREKDSTAGLMLIAQSLVQAYGVNGIAPEQHYTAIVLESH